jgi:adenosylcobyric acid synthase
VLPRISNHTDFDALRLHPDIDLQFIGPMETPPPCDLIILPGSKSVRADLKYLREHRWPEYIHKHLRYGGKVLGICGGLQMLGRRIHDPLALEGDAGSSEGLGFLDIETTLYPEKQLHRVTGTLTFDQANVTGYEIHAGISSGNGLRKPLVKLGNRSDGAISDDEHVAGTYLHGLFDSSEACTAILRWAGVKNAETLDYYALREKNIERLADAMEQHVDMTKVEEIIQGKDNIAPRTVTLVLGGVRSGKSRLAETIAIDSALPITYIATAKAHDDEMRARIEAHRVRRPSHWQCIEEPIYLAATLHEFAKPGQCVIVDCLTLWLTNCLLAEPGVLERERDALLKVVADAQAKIVFVSNETGLGIIPMGELTRRFGDEAGVLNQQLAQISDCVVLTLAGLPLTLKGKL